GLQVLAQVKVEFHQAYGISLQLTDIDPSFTLGNIERQRRETLVRLVTENPESVWKEGDEYFSRNKQLNIGRVIQKVAVIASPNSEGYRDFIHTLENNQFSYKFSIDTYQSTVQGGLAEREMIERLIKIFNSGKQYHCAVIIRGGGAKSDFMVFDSYGLSRAVARFPIPVITGLGHHQDVSIVDMLARSATKTPTKAAEFIIQHNREYEEDMLSLQRSVIIKSQQFIARHTRLINTMNFQLVNNTKRFVSDQKDELRSVKETVTNCTKTIIYENQSMLLEFKGLLTSKPKAIVSQKLVAMANVVGYLQAFTKQYLGNRKRELDHHHSFVKLMSPASILKKGFAIVKMDGKVLKDAATIEKGSKLEILMRDYDVHSTVTSKTKRDETGNDI
ncbi:MAG TPA: exodeoxyribonuclease VII large subunit, partial [Chitinophagaceae bacterium]